ncbi:hypothetical protein A2U01_0096005, partial [Trifolium medium]|nr:hypothetical protein [Trifolium medium]
ESDYDVEKDAPSIKPPAKKVITAKKSSQEVEEVPCDNVSSIGLHMLKDGIMCVDCALL